MKQASFILLMFLSVPVYAVDCQDERFKSHVDCRNDYFSARKTSDRLRTRIKLDFSVEERDAFSFPHEKKEVIKRGSLSFEWVF